MKTFLVYELDTGAIRQRVQAAMLYAQDIPQGCWAKEADADIYKSRMNVSVAPFNPTIEPLPPEPEPEISPSEISAIRAVLEQRPVTVYMVEWDFDSASELRMRDAVDQWDHLAYTKSGNMIGWKDAANQLRLLTKAELTTLLADLRRERAKRSDRLHAHARTLVAQLPAVTRAELDESQWPMN